MKHSTEYSNLTSYIDNKLSFERHKINLYKIYNRNYEQINKAVTKSHEFNKRVINNKIFTKKNNEEIEQFYINQENNVLLKKLSSINKRANLSVKPNKYAWETLNFHKKNIEKCREIYLNDLTKENKDFGLRIQKKKPFITARKLETEYDENVKVVKTTRKLNLPVLEKLKNKLIQQSPVHKQMVGIKSRICKLYYYINIII